MSENIGWMVVGSITVILVMLELFNGRFGYSLPLGLSQAIFPILLVGVAQLRAVDCRRE